MTGSGMDQVLGACLSTDNEQRKKAENTLTQSIETNPKQAASMLAGSLAGPRDDIRGMAAVLMRKKLVQDTNKFNQLDDAAKTQLMQLTLSRLSAEANDQARKKVGDLVVELATAVEGRWPELNPTLMQMVNKAGPAQVTSLYILGELVSQLSLDQNAINGLVKVAGAQFGSTNKDVQIESVLMFGKCICAMPPKAVPQFREVIPSIFQLLTKLLQEGDELNAQKLLQVLIEIAQANATFYRGNIGDVVKMCVAVGSADNFEPGTKNLGLEVLCTIIESEPQMVRRNKNFIDSAVMLSFKMMIGIDEDPDWLTTYETSVEDDENFDAGQVALNRFAEHINAKKFLPILIPKLTDLFGQQDWRMRHAAFVALAQCCELFHQNRTNKQELFERVAAGIKDPHYRVRYSAVHCLGIMCSDFGKKFVNKNSTAILDLFESAMNDSQHPRCQAHATICIVNYAEKVSPKLLRPRLPALLQKLFTMLNQPQKFVQENALSAVSECAENAQDQFVKYYKDFTTQLMRILTQAVGEDYLSLRLESLRCLTYIGVAVGAATFKDHAIEAMRISLPIIQQDGVEVVRILNAWRRIFQTCQDDMAPFIQQVAQVAFKYASQNVKMTDWDSDDEDVEVNDREQPVNASRVEEKVAAINIIYTICKYSSGKAWEIVEPGAKILLPLIDEPIDDSIQEAAAETLPGLLVCMYDATAKNIGGVQSGTVQQLFNMILGKVAQRMPLEESPDSLCSFSICIEKCIGTNPELTRTMDENMLKQVYNTLLTCLKESAQRMDLRNELMKEQDKDDEDIDKLKEQNEQEATLSTHVSDAVGALVKVYKDDFLPVLQTEYQTLNAMLSPEALDIQKRAALYIFCDVVDHCSINVLQAQLSFFVDHFKAAACNVQDVCVRQAGLFALGLLYEKTNGSVKSVLAANDCLKICFAQFTDRNLISQEDVEDVQDNAAMTIGRVCKTCAGDINLAEVYPQWLKLCFPIRNDDDCSQWCYTEMIRLCGQNCQTVLGANNSNLPKIVHWIADVAFTDMSNEELDKALTTLIGNIKSDQAMMGAIASELPQYLMEKLQQHL